MAKKPDDFIGCGVHPHNLISEERGKRNSNFGMHVTYERMIIKCG